MRGILLAGAGALALLSGASIVTAQTPESPAAAATPSAMTAEQKVAYDGWPADRKAAYDGWPADYQAYYWSLTANQQTGWWRLSPEQRQQVMGMDASQRSAAWVSIEAQLQGAPPPAAADAGASAPEQLQANPRGEGPAAVTPPNPATANTPVPPAQPADPNYQGGPYKGALTPPPPEAQNKTYPVCTRKLQDSCRNPGGK